MSEFLTSDFLLSSAGGMKVLKKFKPFILGKCNCGCLEDIPIKSKNKSLQRYKSFEHYNRVKDQTKDKNPNWKGGKYLTSYGYYKIPRPKDDLFKETYKPEHRLIYEKHYNCCLLPITIIHHKNGDTKDNRIENLQPLFRNQHTSHHNKLRYNYVELKYRYCKLCKSSDRCFHLFEDWYICSRCYDKRRRLKKCQQK